MKELIVAADDYGQNEAVDDGILALIEAGRLGAASCLTISPRWPQVARRLGRDVRARADLGVHLDLTEFVRPAGGHVALIAAAHAGALDTGRIRGLLEDQLQRFEDAVGAQPDYVDGHRHVHQLPRVRDALLAALATRYGKRPPWVRVSVAAPDAGWKARLVSLLGGAELAARCRAADLATNDRLLGFYDFDPSAPALRARLLRWLGQARTGDVLMVHPAVRAAPDDPIGAARTTEYEALASLWWAEAMASAGVALARGAVLAVQGANAAARAG